MRSSALSDNARARLSSVFLDTRISLPCSRRVYHSTLTFGYAASALFLSVIPSFLAGLLHTSNIVLLIAPVGLFLGVTPIVQLLLHNLPARRAAVIGLVLEVVRLLGTLYTASIGSLPLLLVAAVIGGSGGGMALLGSLSLINQLIPKEQRGDVFGTYYALNYLSLGVTSIAVGLLTAPLGLTTAVRGVAAVVVVLCLITVVAVIRGLRAQD
jgi:MFS family permease